ncbi:MAG: PT domain-containing protein [Proteobacteria bacterium]|nr:PT domain-containing protein [Pseudomonadota bacterium]
MVNLTRLAAFVFGAASTQQNYSNQGQKDGVVTSGGNPGLRGGSQDYLVPEGLRDLDIKDQSLAFNLLAKYQEAVTKTGNGDLSNPSYISLSEEGSHIVTNIHYDTDTNTTITIISSDADSQERDMETQIDHMKGRSVIVFGNLGYKNHVILKGGDSELATAEIPAGDIAKYCLKSLEEYEVGDEAKLKCMVSFDEKNEVYDTFLAVGGEIIFEVEQDRRDLGANLQGGVTTEVPTLEPTNAPTYQPTASKNPTTQPTGQPTVQPSEQPTVKPTVQPSVQPSEQPNEQPTVQPSEQPTVQPSGKPTVQPTVQPSEQPTVQPSGKPTVQPTVQPSGKPTVQPTVQPSGKPSGQPAGFPTSDPTGQPSEQPSGQPFSPPSGQPTFQPSSQPTSNPSSPTGEPTSAPNAKELGFLDKLSEAEKGSLFGFGSLGAIAVLAFIIKAGLGKPTNYSVLSGISRANDNFGVGVEQMNSKDIKVTTR